MTKPRPSVALVFLPMWDTNWPSIGIGYVAAAVEGAGYPCSVHDYNIEWYHQADSALKMLWHPENYHLWAREYLFPEVSCQLPEPPEKIATRLLSGGATVIGFSVYETNMFAAIEIAIELRRLDPDIFIIFGGPACFSLDDHPTMPVTYFVSPHSGRSLIPPDVVDVFCTGEGEWVMTELLNRLDQNRPLIDIPGTVIRSADGYRLGPKRIRLGNLDDLAFPAWHLYPLEYFEKKHNIATLFSRGCINHCAFCTDRQVWNNRFVRRSAENIFSELKYLNRRHDRYIFNCSDQMLNGDLPLLGKLAELIIAEKMNISWNGNAFIRPEMNREYLSILKRSGLHSLTYGVESLAEPVLSAMGKHYTFRDILSVLGASHAAGIKNCINLITGFPTETEADHRLTLSRLVSVAPFLDHITHIQTCGITRGADLQVHGHRYGITFLADDRLALRWHSQKGTNTPEVRRRRTKEMAEEATRLGLPCNFTGVREPEEFQ